MRFALLIGLAGALVGSSAPAQSDARAQQVLEAVRAQLGGDGFAPDASYAIVFSDLNDDQQQEAIVHLVDPNWCGSGGCTTFVLTYADEAWRQIGRMTVSRLPIYRLPEFHGGWYDLGFYVSGGGVKPGIRAVRFERGSYQSNPTKGPVVPRLQQQGTLLLGPATEFQAVGGQ